MPDTENYTSAAVIVKMKLPLKATFGRNQERHQPSLPIPTPVSFYHERWAKWFVAERAI